MLETSYLFLKALCGRLSNNYLTTNDGLKTIYKVNKTSWVVIDWEEVKVYLESPNENLSWCFWPGQDLLIMAKLTNTILSTLNQ